MATYIHYNRIISDEFNYLLKKNSIKYLISFHKNNINTLFFTPNNFYDACLNNNLNIIKYIYNHLQNKNINFNEALYNSCNQYNIKLFYWLLKFYNFDEKSKYTCLYRTIDYDNLKLFKYIIKKFNLNINYCNNDFIHYSIKKKKIKFIEYLVKEFYNYEIFNDYYYAKNIFFSNNSKIINLLLNNTHFEINQLCLSILDSVIKLGFENSFTFLLKYKLIKDYLKNNIYKYISCCLQSGKLSILKNLIELNINNSLNYTYLYVQSISHGNLEIVKYLYEQNNLIDLTDFIAIERILKYRYFDILLYIIEKKPIFYLTDVYFQEFENIINKNYLSIILKLDNNELIKFFNFILRNNINIKYINLITLINNLIKYNQISKIDLIKNNHINTQCFLNETLFEDSLKSHNLNCIKYAISILNKNLEDYIYEILHHSYLNGLTDIIEELDENNKFKLYSYNLILNKSIYRNDSIIINKILNKDDFNINEISYDVIEMIFKLGNSKILKLLLPKFDNFDFINSNIINEIIRSDNFEIIEYLSNFINISNKVNSSHITEICKYGNTKFMNWFIDLEIYYENFINQSFSNLIIYGHYQQSIYFYNIKNHQKFIDLSDENFYLLKDIIKNNNIYMVRWFLDNFSEINNLQFIIFLELQENINQISKYDNPEILNLILKKYGLNSNNIIKLIYNYSFEKNNYKTLNFLIQNFNIKNYELSIDIKNIFFNSIRNNEYEMIDIIIKNFTNESWLQLTTQFENNKFFTYLLKNYYEYLNINQDLFFNIMYNGNLYYLKNFIKYSRKDIDYSKISEDDYIILFSHNNKILLDYIYQLKNINFNNNYNILKLAVNLNKLTVTEWLLENFEYDNLHNEDDFCFQTSIIYKNLEMLQLLYNYDKKEIFDNYKINYLKIASKIKDLNMFIWISDRFDDIDYTLENNILITNSLSLNNLYVFKYILNKVDIDINYNEGVIITTAFGNNYNEIIKFLFDKYDNIDVLIKNQIIMKYAIEDADIEMLDLLYNYNNNFDLSIDNEYLFRIACKMDNLNAVKWLINKKKDIDYTINNHEIFYYVCDHNFTQVALFLKELDPILYELSIKNNEIESYLVNKKLIINSTICIHKIDICPICIESDSNIITSCEHQYCFNCINILNKKNIELKCPLCRTNIESLKYIKKSELEN